MRHYLFSLIILFSGCSPKTTAELFYKAQQKEKKHKSPKSSKLYKQIASTKTDSSNLDYKLKIIEKAPRFYSKKDIRELYRTKLESDSNNSDLWLLLANTYFDDIINNLDTLHQEKALLDTALHLYDKSIKTDSSSFYPHYKKAHLLNYSDSFYKDSIFNDITSFHYNEACRLGSSDACHYIFFKEGRSYAYYYTLDNEMVPGVKNDPSINFQLNELHQKIENININLKIDSKNAELHYHKALFHYSFLRPQFELFVDSVQIDHHASEAKKSLLKACQLGYQNACIH